MTPKMAGTIVVLIMIAVAIPMFIRTAIWNRFLKYMKQDKEEEALKIIDSQSVQKCNMLSSFYAFNQYLLSHLLDHTNSILKYDHSQLVIKCPPEKALIYLNNIQVQ